MIYYLVSTIYNIEIYDNLSYLGVINSIITLTINNYESYYLLFINYYICITIILLYLVAHPT